MDNPRNLPAPASSISASLSPSSYNWPSKADPDKGLHPLPVGETVARLTACFALVRPVGMGDGDAHAWLTVAASDLAQVPADLLERACAAARRTCTHHSQIVPAIFAEVEADWEWRKRRRFEMLERSPSTTDDLGEPPEPLSQAEVDRIAAERGRALSICLDRGEIVRANGGAYLPGKPVKADVLARLRGSETGA